MSLRRLPRRLHAGAWWLWAIGMGAAATRTTNPLLLGLILAVVGLVVAARRTPDSPDQPLRLYLVLALIVIAFRVVFRILLGGGLGDHVIFSLPRLPLPEWWAGVVIGGPVTAESLLAAFSDGLRLATIVVCVGAANALADPRRLLRSLPRALYDAGAAAVVALSLAPQIIESIRRVRRARRLRGEPGTGLASLRSLLLPVLEDAMDRSLALAAAMDSRGYGRLGPSPIGRRRLGGALGMTAVASMAVGVFGLVGGALSSPLVGVLMAGGAAAGVGAMGVAGQTVGRSVYRPDIWGPEGWAVAGAGVAAAVAVWAAGLANPTDVTPSLEPLVWPALSPMAVGGILLACLPAWASPVSPAPEPALRATEGIVS